MQYGGATCSAATLFTDMYSCTPAGKTTGKRLRLNRRGNDADLNAAFTYNNERQLTRGGLKLPRAGEPPGASGDFAGDFDLDLTLGLSVGGDGREEVIEILLAFALDDGLAGGESVAGSVPAGRGFAFGVRGPVARRALRLGRRRATEEPARASRFMTNLLVRNGFRRSYLFLASS